MPHLQFEINKKIDPEVKEKFISSVLKIFGDVMKTDISHVAVSLREYDSGNLSLGRINYKDPICLMNLDIRAGREIEKRCQLATEYFILVNTLFKIGKKNQYITFTEHKGEDFHLIEKYLADWVANDKPISD
jgi:phenylpyruvate tautomerase PptA (4-oxalocrotonate tautomerase family)